MSAKVRAATVVLLLSVPAMAGTEDSGRVALLTRRFPELASTSRRSAPYLADPMLRRGTGNPEEERYDQALGALIAAQYQLAMVQQEMGDWGSPYEREGRDRPRDRRPADGVETAWRAVLRAEREAQMARPPGALEGPRVEADTLLILFHERATPDEIAGVLARNQFRVLSGIAEISLFVVDLPGRQARTEEGETSRLRALVQRLEETEPLVETAVESVALSATSLPPPNVPTSGRDFYAAGDPLVLSHFPEAWNFADAIRNRGGHVGVGVLDVGFVDQPDDLTMGSASPCGTAVDVHGTQVAGIIGARFGDRTGVDGAALDVEMVGCAPVRAGADYLAGALKTLLEHLPNLPVINASVGYNWPKITPLVKEIVEGHGTIVRRLLRVHPDAIVVASAGNDCAAGCAEPAATWTSPFNWAALGPASADLPVSGNVIVVEALDRTGRALLPLSNVSGMISAIGEGLLTVTDAHSFGVMIASTSAAAPLVTATVAMMLKVNPNLSARQIKTNLGVGKCDHRLNAFEAVLLSSPNAAADLADFNGDRRVDRDDFLRFRTVFRQIRAMTFTEDLNDDNVIDANDAKFCRMDLDGNGAVDQNDLEVLFDGWTTPNVDRIALRVELTK